MPFTQFNRALEAAVGYFELGMADEALKELDVLPPEDQLEEEVLELRSVLNQHLGRWEAASHCCEALCRVQGADPDRFIAWATCLYELGEVPASVAALLQAPANARSHALWNFHLACYEAILGHPVPALEHVHACLALDPRMRPMVEHNSHLRPLLDSNDPGRATGT